MSAKVDCPWNLPRFTQGICVAPWLRHNSQRYNRRCTLWSCPALRGVTLMLCGFVLLHGGKATHDEWLEWKWGEGGWGGGGSESGCDERVAWEWVCFV